MSRTRSNAKCSSCLLSFQCQHARGLCLPGPPTLRSKYVSPRTRDAPHHLHHAMIPFVLKPRSRSHMLPPRSYTVDRSTTLTASSVAEALCLFGSRKLHRNISGGSAPEPFWTTRAALFRCTVARSRSAIISSAVGAHTEMLDQTPSLPAFHQEGHCTLATEETFLSAPQLLELILRSTLRLAGQRDHGVSGERRRVGRPPDRPRWLRHRCASCTQRLIASEKLRAVDPSRAKPPIQPKSDHTHAQSRPPLLHLFWMPTRPHYVPSSIEAASH